MDRTPIPLDPMFTTSFSGSKSGQMKMSWASFQALGS